MQDLAHLCADLYQFVSRAEVATEPRERSRLQRFGNELALRFRSAGLDGRRIEQVAQRLREGSARGDLLARLGRDYESLLVDLRRRGHALPKELLRLKPRNYQRNLFHFCNGLIGIGLYRWIGERGTVFAVALAVLCFFVALDVGRRVFPALNDLLMNVVCRGIARPHEAHHTPAAVWYVAALAIAVPLLPHVAVELGVLSLAVGDPIAALCGKAWGARKILGEKSWAGAIGCFLSTAVAGALYGAWLAPDLGLATIAAAALAASVAETLSTRVDDNFTIPLATGAVVALLL
jgi:dolichol kinase